MYFIWTAAQNLPLIFIYLFISFASTKEPEIKTETICASFYFVVALKSVRGDDDSDTHQAETALYYVTRIQVAVLVP